MKKWIIGIILIAGLFAVAGSVGLPAERIALPQVEGDHLVCVWDATAENWVQSHVAYDNSGAYSLQVPEWNKWYWVGLWDSKNQLYVFGKWIGHFRD